MAVTQTYAPAMLHMLNLAGMGLLAWDRASHEPERPFAYKTAALPVFDPNLKGLALKVRARRRMGTIIDMGPRSEQVTSLEQKRERLLAILHEMDSVAVAFRIASSSFS